MTEPKYLDAGSSGQYGWHSTELALRCPRLFALNYRQKPAGTLRDPATEPDRPALLKGSLMHQGLAHHYLRRKIAAEGGNPDEWAKPSDAIDWCAKKLGPHAAKYVNDIKLAVAQYEAHWMQERLEVLHVEEIARAEVDGHPFTQRFDLVVREPDGKVYIYDHKTTGRLSKSTGERYTISGQFLGMANFGASLYGSDFGGVKINFIELPDSGPCRFSRQLVDPAPAAVASIAFSIGYARKLVEEFDRLKLPADQWPGVFSEQTCITAYGRCDFFEKCRWGA
jgi:hypothetical protein